jgi:hypothetical protein
MRGEAVVWAIKRHQLAEAARRQKGQKKGEKKTCACRIKMRVRVGMKNSRIRCGERKRVAVGNEPASEKRGNQNVKSAERRERPSGGKVVQGGSRFT